MHELVRSEAEWVLRRLSESVASPNDRNYYQGRIDSLEWVLRNLPEEG